MYLYLAIGFLFASLGLLLLYRYQKNRDNAKSFVFYGGLAYLLVGLPILISWFYLVSIAFFVIGLILIVLNRFSIPKFLQVILVILPVTILIVWSLYEEASYNIFLIPKDYKGRVVIIHDCKDGAEKEFEGRNRVYRISPNGLLKTKFSFAGRAFDNLHSSYFYVDASGKRESISQDLNEKEKIIVYGIWTLRHDNKGKTNIDFIVDKQVEDVYSYKSEEDATWQKEIDSCRN